MKRIDLNTKDSHGGNPAVVAANLGLRDIPAVTLDFSVNVNPFGMPLYLEREFLAIAPGDLTIYPEPHAESATAKFADAHLLPHDELLLGNGSMELFQLLALALKPLNACCVAPCYSGYAEACQSAGVDLRVARNAESSANFAVSLSILKLFDGEMLFIASPNNPTGTTIPPNDVLEFATDNPTVFVVIDESFIDFLPDRAEKSLFSSKLIPANLAVVKSMTKFHAIPGARLGVMRASKEIIAKAAAVQLPWSVNAIAQRLAKSIDPTKDDTSGIATEIRELSGCLSDALENIALETPTKDGESENQNSSSKSILKIYPGEANFLLCEIRDGAEPATAEKLQKKLLKDGILIRSCANVAGLGERYFRVAVRTESENAILAGGVFRAFSDSAKLSDTVIRSISDSAKSAESDACDANTKAMKKYRPIMVLGTTSDAGKSLVAAGLCRYFSKQGVKVAPFKAQNMSLNSFVTQEGYEMGRAQVTQAQAAGIDPHVDMNPVLLKPTGENGSQVIVNGKPRCSATAREYYGAKREFRDEARAVFDRLSDRYELIVLEGAGSPAEINLQDDDFVNTAMAEYADAACVLVADINPGGVFASIYGTVRLIPERHRHLLKGIIINKFRGDESLLDDGIRDIERLTGIPVLKVMPYLNGLAIEDEDGMSLDAADRDSRGIDPSLIDVAVIRLPRISNFTDFLALENTPGIALRYVSNPRKLGKPDLIIIPGSKNTIGDMRFLRESGFEPRLQAARNARIPIFGICGGYQMLGEMIEDPDGVEGETREIRGLGFLPLKTVLSGDKELAQVAGETLSLSFAKSGAKFKGYEIHMGETFRVNGEGRGEDAPIIVTTRGELQCRELRGAASTDGLVFGCYVHGFFDESSIRTSLLAWLPERSPEKGRVLQEGGMLKAGRKSLASYDPIAERERSFDILAEHLAPAAKALLTKL